METNPSKGKCGQVQPASAGDICSDNVLYVFEHTRTGASAEHGHIQRQTFPSNLLPRARKKT